MKKRNKMILISQEQMRKEPWTAFAQIQQQAKTATISVDADIPADSPDSQIEAVAAADPLRVTLGGLINAVQKAKDSPLISVGSIPAVSLARRLVVITGDDSQDARTAIAAATNVVKSAELTFDGAETNNAPMTNTVANGTGIATPINAALAAAKPSFSLQSIINKLEDLLLATGGAQTGVVVVDQAAEKVYLYTCPVANEATLLAVVNSGSVGGLGASGAFDVDATPAASVEGQFGE